MHACIIPGFLLCPNPCYLPFLSHLTFIYVSLYFAYPCKVPYVLRRIRQRINTWINIASTWLAPHHAGPLAPHHASLLLGLLAQSKHKVRGSVPVLGWCPRPATQDFSQFLASSCLDILVNLYIPLALTNISGCSL